MKYSALSAISRDTAMRVEQMSASNTQTLAFDASAGARSFYAAAGAAKCVYVGEVLTVAIDDEPAIQTGGGAGVIDLSLARGGTHKLAMSGSGVVLLICKSGAYR
ncbi:MAG: hypothetical protein HFH71_06235 [Clostridia bacterium]|nr:hypothetical protein [Clostridia bacterium]